MFSESVFPKSPVDVVFAVRNVIKVRTKRMKTVLFRESNFCAEKELLLFFIAWSVFQNSKPVTNTVLLVVFQLLWKIQSKLFLRLWRAQLEIFPRS